MGRARLDRGTRRAGGLLALLIMTATAAACGGEGGSSGAPTSTPGSAPLTQAEWAERADVVCARADERVNALANPSTIEEFISFEGEVLDIVQATRAGLNELGAPVGGGADFAKVLRGYDEAIAHFRKLTEKLEARGADAGEEVLDDPAITAEYDAGMAAAFEAAQAALRLGSRKCGAAALTEVDLEPVGASGERGTVEITPVDDRHMRVVVELSEPPATRQSADIFAGPCDRLIAPIFEYKLEDVVAGRSETTVPTTLNELRANLLHYSVVVSSHGGKPVACGTLPVP